MSLLSSSLLLRLFAAKRAAFNVYTLSLEIGQMSLLELSQSRH